MHALSKLHWLMTRLGAASPVAAQLLVKQQEHQEWQQRVDEVTAGALPQYIEVGEGRWTVLLRESWALCLPCGPVPFALARTSWHRCSTPSPQLFLSVSCCPLRSVRWRLAVTWLASRSYGMR